MTNIKCKCRACGEESEIKSSEWIGTIETPQTCVHCTGGECYEISEYNFIEDYSNRPAQKNIFDL